VNPVKSNQFALCPAPDEVEEDPARWAEIDHYFADFLIPSDPALEAALQLNEAEGLPAHSVSPHQGKLLMLLAQAVGARAILEVGSLGGYSTIWLARALPPGGRVVTLELKPKRAAITRANVARAGLADRVEQRVGAALETLPTLAAEAPFDLIFIDADRENLGSYFQWAVKLSRPGTLIVVDNAVPHGDLIESEESNSEASLRRFYELAAAEPKVTMTAIQTVGVKGHDGFAIALVTSASPL
jgi:predicted O-methyltransferase YrrM